jgi:mannose-6-phosphate isomerase
MFKFKPIYKELIWGGHDILPYKGLLADSRKIGESWELSGVEGNKSVVSESVAGEAGLNEEGKTIDELIAGYGERLLGKSVIEKTGTTFPLLLKFIDAQDDLSIQVHPNDDLAMQRHNSFGKTEMWCVVNTKPGAFLYSGFSRQITPEEYVKRVEDSTIIEVLQRYEVKAGDVFFLPAGRVHAIGKGCFIAEIQQTSNITYRIYDYDRKDANGNGRELHTELAKDAIDYTLYPEYKTCCTPVKNKEFDLIQCKYFTTKLLDTDQLCVHRLDAVDSFVIYTCLAGEAEIINNHHDRMHIRQGEVMLIPAETSFITIKADGYPVKMLITYIEK